MISKYFPRFERGPRPLWISIFLNEDSYMQSTVCQMCGSIHRLIYRSKTEEIVSFEGWCAGTGLLILSLLNLISWNFKTFRAPSLHFCYPSIYVFEFWKTFILNWGVPAAFSGRARSVETFNGNSFPANLLLPRNCPTYINFFHHFQISDMHHKPHSLTVFLRTALQQHYSKQTFQFVSTCVNLHATLYIPGNCKFSVSRIFNNTQTIE